VPEPRLLRLLLDASAVPDRPVGAGVYTIELARGLDARPDVDLVLLTRRGDTERWGSIAPRAELFARVPDARPLRLAWERWNGARVAHDAGIDVWHGPHYTMPGRLDRPAVVTVHDLTFFDTPETHERAKVAWFRHAIRTSSRHAARIVCVSENTAARLDAVVPHHAPVTVAPHGVDHARFSAHADEAVDRARLAARGIGAPYVAFAGTAEPRKNLPALVAAFARVAATRADLRLVLAGGDGWGEDALRVAITQHSVATRVVRPGYLDDDTIAALYRRAAVVAYPSLAEGFGLPALEALACAAPLVTARGTAMDEFVADAALTVDPRDTEAIADAIERALDPAVAAHLRARGPLVAAPYTWERSVDAHVAAYREAVRSAPSAASGASADSAERMPA
jgi:glycosyltransferase involved in cell wall biosynthesis